MDKNLRNHLINPFSVLAEDKIELVPLINLEELSPTLEEDKIELEKLGNESSLRRWGEPKEVAKTCLMIVSDNFSFVTGQTIIIDGGTVMF